MSSELRKYSPVICWTSEWNAGSLTKVKMNKESRVYQKALDKLASIKTWEKNNGGQRSR
jgi:hypothetical protein